MYPDCADDCPVLKYEKARQCWNENTKEKWAKAKKDWKIKNKEHLQEYEKLYRPVYRRKNRERINRKWREWYQKKKEADKG